MGRPIGPTELPVVAFIREMSRKRDPLAMIITSAVLFFALVILSLPFSRTVQVAAAERFHLARWRFGGWALFQPLPSMYNLENSWQVTFTPDASSAEAQACEAPFRGFINHHVFNRILLQRAGLELCGLPARVRFETTYRTTTVETDYLLTANPGSHGFTVVPLPQ